MRNMFTVAAQHPSDADNQQCTWLSMLQAAALAAAAEKDPVAEKIGAANTLVRRQDGSLAAYNTDWSAAISAIERGMTSAAGVPAKLAAQ
jgi:hypothetical protein